MPHEYLSSTSILILLYSLLNKDKFLHVFLLHLQKLGSHSILLDLSLQNHFHLELSKLKGPNFFTSSQHWPSHDGVMEVSNIFSVSSGFM